MAVSVTRTVHLERSVEEAFAYLADFTHTEQWDPGTIRTTRTDDGPLGVGAQFHNTSTFRGRETELDYELTVHEPHSRLVFVGENKTVTSTDELTFRTLDDKSCSLTYSATLDFKGLAKLAGPFLKKGFEQVADEAMEKLQQAIRA